MSRRLAAMVKRLASVACVLGVGGCQVAAQLPPIEGGRSVVSSRSVIVQLFEWRWSDVAQECEAWLGPHGYGAVQISPPHEHRLIDEGAVQFPWYQRYQPVSYKLSSRSGDRADLADMISRCHQAGVKVYADVVLNHMASSGVGQGIGGSRFDTSEFFYGDIPYDRSDFHAPCDIAVSDYNQQPWRVQQCQLAGQQDLKTSSEKVQAAIAEAMNELLELGVAGFRIDSAQHIPAQDLAKILRRLRPLNTQFHSNGGRPFIYQDIAHKGADSIKASHYFSNGAVTELGYGRHLGEQVRHGQLKNLMLFGEAWGLMPTHKAVVFTDNHRTQRSGDLNIITFHSLAAEGAQYQLANVFMLAWPYGTPKVMSSYDWPQEQGTAAGPPADEYGQTLPVSCGDGWVCEHRLSAIANMVEFRNVTQGAITVDYWWDNGDNQIAFARGERGFVAINNEKAPLRQTLMTGLPPGQYCNVLALQEAYTEHDGRSEPGDCEHSLVEVDALGYVQIEVLPYQALAIHIGARLQPSK